MYRIIFDTNFLVDLIRFKIGLEEIEKLVNRPAFLVLTSTTTELKKLSEKKSPVAKYAKVAIGMIKTKGFRELVTNGISFDQEVFGVLDKGTIVATNDSKLRKKLNALGVKTIYLRARKKLEMS